MIYGLNIPNVLPSSELFNGCFRIDSGGECEIIEVDSIFVKQIQFFFLIKKNRCI